MSVQWTFPPSNWGVYQGFNNPGIETFAGARFASLAREIIQNSLDASEDGDSKVSVKFEFLNIAREDFPGLNGLLDVMKRCAAEKNDEKAKAFFSNAIKVLQKRKIPCLRISDSGTTGLRGSHLDHRSQWSAMTKGVGVSEKSDPTAGGSYGIGKNAPFAVSDLRTVFYSTLYKGDDGETVVRAQGTSILMSHKIEGDDHSQAIGFYCEGEKSAPIENGIPSILHPEKQGCVVFIPGFIFDADWAQKIKATVLVNFFCAINEGKLDVLIQSDMEDVDVIKQENLDACFEDVKKSDDDNDEVTNSYHYYRVIKSAEHCFEKTLDILGACKMWLQVKEGLPKRVALVRKTGMLITDEQNGLKRWVGCSDFAGVLICESDEGNAMLRDMENPQHNAFEPDRVSTEQERKKAKKALKEMCNWIRGSVKELAKPKESEVSEIDELNEFFPDVAPEETIAGDKGERNIEGRSIYSLKPLKNAKTQSDPVHEEGGKEGGADADHDGSEGGGGGVGEGVGEGEGVGTGGSGTKMGKKTVKIKNVRVVADAADGSRKTVYFSPEKEGRMQLILGVSGDDGNAEPITIASATSSSVADVRVTGKTVEILVEKPVDEAIVRIALQVLLAKPTSDSIVVNAFEN